MDIFTRDDLKALLSEPRAHRVSIFMPTHRGGAEEDPIRWRRHLDEAEKRLVANGLRTPEARKLLEPARRLLEEPSFWKGQCDGLAAFLAPQFLRLYRLPLALEDLVAVGGHFHVTPLLPLLGEAGRFYVLALSRNSVRLLQGSHYSVSEVELKGVPRNMEEALATHDRDEPLTFHARPTSGGGWGAIFEGHGVGIDDAKDDLLLYFQRIDRGLHPILREEKAPLVLAAVDYLHPIYRQASTYAHLLEQGIEGNPDRLSDRELHDRAWALVGPRFESAKKRAVAQYRQLAGTGRTASELEEVLAAACRGEVETLFVTRGEHRWGRFDAPTGILTVHEPAEPGDEDLLNLAAIHTLAHGNTVYPVAVGELPDDGPVAAVFRLPLARHQGKRP